METVRFYLALSNESTESRSVTVTLDRERNSLRRRSNLPRAVCGLTGKASGGTTTVTNGTVETAAIAPRDSRRSRFDEMPVFYAIASTVVSMPRSRRPPRRQRLSKLTRHPWATRRQCSYHSPAGTISISGPPHSDSGGKCASRGFTLKAGQMERTLLDERPSLRVQR